MTPNTMAWLRMKIREIREDANLSTMAAADPDEYVSAVRTLTGWSPDELADLTGDEDIRPLRSETVEAVQS